MANVDGFLVPVKKCRPMFGDFLPFAVLEQ